MKKLFLIIPVTLLLVGSYLFFKQDKDIREELPVELETETVSEALTEKARAGTSTLEQILAEGKNQECSIVYVPAGDLAKQISGNLFTGGSSLRGDFVSAEMATGSVASIIVDANTIYSWSIIENEAYGMRADRALLKKMMAEGSPVEFKSPIELTQAVEYQCKNWSATDASIFVPPSDILFKDFAATVNTGMEYGTLYEETGDNSPCALCQKVAPGPGQDECRANFKCQ